MSCDPNSSQYYGTSYGQQVQQPVFASNSGSNQISGGDDFDLNEIFADYFLDEVNATLTPSVVNVHHPSQNLPTGRGIQTAWHSTAASTTTQNQQDDQQAWKKTKYTAPPQDQYLLGDNDFSAQPSPAPTSVMNAGDSQQHPQSQVQQQQQAPRSSSALTGRLGFQMGVKNTYAQPSDAAHTMSSLQESNTTSVNLPVGVGIRVPGAVQHQNQATTAPVGAIQHNQWGKGGITLSSHGIPAGGGAVNKVNGLIPGMGVDLSKFGTGGTADDQMAERRQRNREHAKRSRVRKKFMLESLQEDVRQLQRENTDLRMIIQDKLPDLAQKILDECCSVSYLFKDENPSSIVMDNNTNNSNALMRSDFNLIQSLTSSQRNFVLSDPRLPDNPIVYASEGFYQMTGYAREQVLGRNCRFLQGPGTDPKHIDLIRNAVAKGNDFSICILNYKADGTPFWNQLFVAALRDNDNCIVNFIGVQCSVDTESESTFLEDKVNSVLPLAVKDDQ